MGSAVIVLVEINLKVSAIWNGWYIQLSDVSILKVESHGLLVHLVW